MGFECPSSTSEDKQLALRGLEHGGHSAVDRGGGGSSLSTQTCAAAALLQPPRLKTRFEREESHWALNLSAGGSSRQTALRHWDPNPPANCCDPHSCINYPVQCWQLIKWRLTKESSAEICVIIQHWGKMKSILKVITAERLNFKLNLSYAAGVIFEFR